MRVDLQWHYIEKRTLKRDIVKPFAYLFSTSELFSSLFGSITTQQFNSSTTTVVHTTVQ